MKKKKKKHHKRTKKPGISFKKLASFTSRKLNKAYEDFKNKQKIKEKKELKLKEEQIQKEQIVLKRIQQRELLEKIKGDDTIKNAKK